MDLLEKAASGCRLTADEGIELYSYPLFDLGAAANEVRRMRTDPQIVTYLIDRNINYTNICNIGCSFCGFYRTRSQSDSYTLSFEEIGEKVKELEAVGGTRILMQGGVNPNLQFDWYLDLLEFLKQSHPDIRVEAFSPEEIKGLSTLSGRPSLEILEKLRDAGLDGLPGGGGEILVDKIRKHRRIAPARIGSDEWLQIMGEAQSIGIYTTATMVIGFGETKEDRVQSILRVRERHEESLEKYGNGFSAFISWNLQTKNVRVEGVAPGSNSHEYLRNLAVSRLLLDKVVNFQVSWPTMGYKVAQTGLYFGANDFGSTMLEENVVSQAGAQHQMASEKEIIRQITDAGFQPVQRDSNYCQVRRPSVNDLPKMSLVSNSGQNIALN